MGKWTDPELLVHYQCIQQEKKGPIHFGSIVYYSKNLLMEKIIQLKLFLTATAIAFAVLFFNRIVSISLFHIEKMPRN